MFEELEKNKEIEKEKSDFFANYVSEVNWMKEQEAEWLEWSRGFYDRLFSDFDITKSRNGKYKK